MNKSRAVILHPNPDQRRIVASSARISTQQGTAMEIYEKSGDVEKDLKLVGKVLSSGHKSVIEHQTVSIAFNDVSVMAEQFVIEYRLASYTVKSRRYVDFSDAGYVVPDDMSAAVRDVYARSAEALFNTYRRLMELGVPKEDARFVLPYGFRSNFFVTMNARELMHMICAMVRGRGARFAEIRALGEQLKRQFDEMYPDVLDAQLKSCNPERVEASSGDIAVGDALLPKVEIIGAPTDPMGLLDTAIRFARRFSGADEASIRALLADDRPRELEALYYTFRIDHASLACVTHFTRHRMLSLMLHHELSALADGNYVLPESVSQNAQAHELYVRAFEAQAAAAREAKNLGANDASLTYFAMAGHTTSMLISMNAREILHFAKLRACSRAQWEIRGIARDLIACLNATAARSLFRFYGPTCAVTGKCPEGKMSCGRRVRIVDGEWKTVDKA